MSRRILPALAAFAIALAACAETATAFSLDPGSVVVSSSGDMAYETGTYSWTGPAPDGTEVTSAGKYAAVWRQEDGNWKMAVDIWNGDGAPAAPQAGSEAAGEDAWEDAATTP